VPTFQWAPSPRRQAEPSPMLARRKVLCRLENLFRKTALRGRVLKRSSLGVAISYVEGRPT
jgi:hypothetical protein